MFVTSDCDLKELDNFVIRIHVTLSKAIMLLVKLK